MAKKKRKMIDLTKIMIIEQDLFDKQNDVIWKFRRTKKGVRKYRLKVKPSNQES